MTATVGYGDGSGVQSLTLNPDRIFTLSHTYADSGTYTVTVTVTDDAGGVGSDTAVITVDGIAPATLATLSGTTGNNGWYVSDVALSLVASDNDGGSGVKEIYYSINGGEETIVAGASASFNLAAEGESVVTYFAKDNAGNTEAENSLTVKIDKTPPTITGSRNPGPNANGWNNTDITVSFTATDDISGVDTVSPDVTISTEGVGQSATGTATDKAGNSTSATVSDINIDKTPPTLTFGAATPAPNAAGWNNSDISVPFTASDSLSGVANTNPAASPLVLTAEGSAVTGNVAVTDKAGNSASFTTSPFKIDKTKPAISVNSPQAKDYLTSESIQLDFSATDATSGVGNLVAALDSTPVTNGQVINLETMAGSHTLTVSATDNAGNSHRAEVTFQVVIEATVDINPDTLNLKSKSDKNAITAYIELPAGYSVTDINVATVKLKVNGTEIVAQLTPTSVGDYDKNGVADRMVKFDRQAVVAALAGRTGDITLTVSGELTNGRFSGTDTIKVINPGK